MADNVTIKGLETTERISNVSAVDNGGNNTEKPAEPTDPIKSAKARLPCGMFCLTDNMCAGECSKCSWKLQCSEI